VHYGGVHELTWPLRKDTVRVNFTARRTVGVQRTNDLNANVVGDG